MWIRIKIDSDLKMGNCRLSNKIHALHNQFFLLFFEWKIQNKSWQQKRKFDKSGRKNNEKKSKIKEWNSDRDNAHHFPYKAFRHIVYYPQSEYAKLNRYDCFMQTFTSSFFYYEWRALQNWNVCALYCLKFLVYSTGSILFCFISLRKFNSFIPFAVLFFYHVRGTTSSAEMRYVLRHTSYVRCTRFLMLPQST